MVWWRGRKWNHIKRVFEVEVFYYSQNIDFPFYLKRFLELFSLFFSTFSPSLSLSFYMLHLLRTWEVLMILEVKNHFFKNFFFKWNGMEWLSVNIRGRRIFRNGVMHANMAKPWSWRWASCGYIDGGRIFQSGGMHTDIFNLQINFEKSSKLKWTHLLTKFNTNKSF
jgi:hypothetical protein